MLAPTSARFRHVRFRRGTALAAVLAAALALAAAGGCAGGGQTYKIFSASRPSPDAVLHVTASVDPSGATRLRMRARKLAEPSWVRPKANSWRVWARANEAQAWRLLGELGPDRSLGPVTVPGRVFEMWVTPEIAPRPLGPTYAPTFSRRFSLQ